MMTIYKITNKINGKSYIGQTINFEGRMKEHFNDKNSYYLIHKAIRKYGKENFDVEILKEFDYNDYTLNDKAANGYEIYYIALYETYYKNKKGYNMTHGGHSIMRNKEFTVEHRRKLSAALKGKKSTISEEKRKQLAMLRIGKKFGPRSEETKQKISIKRRGKKHTPEAILKIKEKRKLQVMFPRSEETKEKLRQANIGKKMTIEQRQKMSDSHKSKKQSPELIEKRRLAVIEYWKTHKKIVSEETKRKLSESHMGHKPSPETIKKRLETMKKKKLLQIS